MPDKVGFTASVTLTRTADTNAYTAGDVVGAATGSTAALEFTNIGSPGRDIRIVGCELLISATAVISGETSYKLYLYNITPPSALDDNAAWDLPSGDRASYLGSIDLGTPADIGSSLFIETAGMTKHVKLEKNGSLFGYLVTTGAHTPTSERVYKVTLHSLAL